MGSVFSCATCGAQARGARVLRASTPLHLRALRPWARRYDAIRLEFLEGDQRERLEQALERDYLACGCGAGRAAFGATLALLAVAALVFKEALFAHMTEFVVGGLLMLALVTLSAMLGALIRARLRVNLAVDRLLGSGS